MTIDPWISLLVGALGASLIGLLGAAIQAAREHRKWLRERRFEAYRAFMVDMNTAQSIVATKPTRGELENFKQRVKTYAENASHAFEAVSLLGPRNVNRAGQRWMKALGAFAENRDDGARVDAVNAARWRFLVVAGRVLKSRNVTEHPPE